MWIKRNIPNFITLLNLLSGATACILSFSYADTIVWGLTAWQCAFIAIAAAAAFDFWDGAAARLLHSYSPLGKELDSLADLISFGLAPSLLLYNTFIYFNGGAFTPWALISLLVVLCGALRLAKFNIDTRQTTSFIGLPIPANAIFWIGAISWFHTHLWPAQWIVAILIIAISLLMVSELKMPSLKFKNFALRENFARYLIILATIIFLATAGIQGLAWSIILYILIALVLPKH